MNINKIGEKTALFVLNPFLNAIVSLKDIRDGVSLFSDL